jgi:flavin reductase (DIM6/NTAB) family NADH-FMN oxidoreductase RutF
MKEEWLRAFGQMINGLYVLTTRHEEKINGMIASWVTQVSYEPPLILVAVHPDRYSHKLIEKSKSFALHTVQNTRHEMIERMMGPDPAAKFAGIDWEPGITGCPILKDCLAWFECKVTHQQRPGNHTLFTGQAVQAGIISSGRPLCTLDCRGAYTGRT